MRTVNVCPTRGSDGSAVAEAVTTDGVLVTTTGGSSGGAGFATAETGAASTCFEGGCLAAGGASCALTPGVGASQADAKNISPNARAVAKRNPCRELGAKRSAPPPATLSHIRLP